MKAQKTDTQNNSLFLLIESIYKISLNLPKDKLQLLPQIIEDLRRALKSSIESQTAEECLKSIASFSSEGQLKSKLWLIQTLKELELSNLGLVFLCAGWCGFLAYLLFQEESLEADKIINFDIDPLSIQISEDLNRKWVIDDWKFKAALKNILELDYHLADFETLKKDGSAQRLKLSPDTIINTSCEHIKNFKSWWRKLPKDKLLVLQSNNFHSIEEHINCVSSLKEFEKQAPLGSLLFKGALDLGEYKRFMLIGKKI